jgi:hypothetical protein
MGRHLRRRKKRICHCAGDFQMSGKISSLINAPVSTAQAAAVATAKSEAIAAAAADATAKANAAQSASTPAAHAGSGGAAHAIATTSAAGFMSAADKTKIDATSGSNTGDETAATIKSKLGITTLSGSNTGDQTSITGNAGTATKLATARTINAIPFDGTANISLAKGDIGLGNVDNTSDAAKPVSTAQQTALDNRLRVDTAAQSLTATQRGNALANLGVAIQSSPTDTTAGSLMAVGSFGLGGDAPAVTDLDALSGTRFFSFSETAVGAPYTGGGYDALGWQSAGIGQRTQFASISTASGMSLLCRIDDGSGFAAWKSAVFEGDTPTLAGLTVLSTLNPIVCTSYTDATNLKAWLQSSAGGTAAAPTKSLSGTRILGILARGHSGQSATSFHGNYGAAIEFVAAEDGNTGNGTDIVFSTSPKGGDTGRVGRTRVTSEGAVLINVATSNGTDKLQVAGSASLSGTLKIGSYTLATLPSASAYSGYLIDVSNAAGGPKVCRSNGTVWQILNTTTTVS